MNYLEMTKTTISKSFVFGAADTSTASLLNKLADSVQLVGFAGGILMLAGCFALMMWAGEGPRQKIKSHLLWVVIGIVGLFAAAALATFFKSYSQGSF